jgi:hypothetical protein
LKDLGLLTYERFLKLFRLLAGLLGRVISPSQGLYLHRTTLHRKTRTNIHALSEIRTHDPSVRAIKAHAPDHWATVNDNLRYYLGIFLDKLTKNTKTLVKKAGLWILI